MGTYQWRGHEIVLNQKEEQFRKITKMIIEHQRHAQKEFEEKYKEKGRGYDIEAIQNLSVLAEDILKNEIEGIERDIKKAKLYHIDLDAIMHEYYASIFHSINEVDLVLRETVYEIKGQQEKIIELREERKQTRSRWTGGGFGIKGAVKGAVQAEILNAATGAAMSAVNIIGNLRTSIKANREIEKLKNDFGRKALQQAISEGLRILHGALLEDRGIKELYSPKEIADNEFILRQYRDDVSASGEEYLFFNIKTNPYNAEQYKVLIKKYGDRDGTLEKIGNEFGIDIEKIKAEIFFEECDKQPSGNSADAEYNKYVFLKSLEERLGFQGKTAPLEKSKQSLIKEIEKQQEQVRSSVNLRDKKSVHDAIVKLKEIKDPFDITNSYIQALESVLQNIDIQERTVNNVLFNTVEEANQEREHYVSGVRYESIDEAKRIRQEKERQIQEELARERYEAEKQEKKRKQKEKDGITFATISCVFAVISWIITPNIRIFFILALVGVVLGLLSRIYNPTKRSWIGIILGGMVVAAVFMGTYDDTSDDSADTPETVSNTKLQETVNKKETKDQWEQMQETSKQKEDEGNNLAKQYEGEWWDLNSQRCYMDIKAIGGNKLSIIVSWSSGYADDSKWEMTGQINERNGKIVYNDCTQYDIHNNEYGEEQKTVNYTNGKGCFYLGDGGYLYWEDEIEYVGLECYFEKDNGSTGEQEIADYSLNIPLGNATRMYVVQCEASITLRNAPSTSAAEITQIPLYAEVDYYGSLDNGFAQVSYNGQMGYVLQSYLDPYEPQVATGIMCQIVNCQQSVTLRTSITIQDKEICQVPLGASVDYIDEGENGFCLVNYNGMMGYIQEAYLMFIP